jgi:predicted nucleic acid-binding protein
MAINLFVDTNIFLSLYAFSEDDLMQFRNLFILSQEGEIKFFLPKQVIDEFWRNREAKIAEAIKDFRLPVSRKVPALARDLPESSSYEKDAKQHISSHKLLVDAVIERAKSNKLSADELVGEIFEKSKVIDVTDEILSRAQARVEVGNPPGKKGSLGDALNWECILSEIGLLQTLCFVSRDKDYRSALHDNQFNEFLARELMEMHIADVKFFPSLRTFMAAKFPNAPIEAFTEASKAVAELEASGSFYDTHIAIEKLSQIDHFSINQIKRLIAAAEENSQVNWILSDDDVFKFYKLLLNGFSEKIPGQLKEKLQGLLPMPEASVPTEDEIPF